MLDKIHYTVNFKSFFTFIYDFADSQNSPNKWERKKETSPQKKRCVGVFTLYDHFEHFIW